MTASRRTSGGPVDVARVARTERSPSARRAVARSSSRTGRLVQRASQNATPATAVRASRPTAASVSHTPWTRWCTVSAGRVTRTAP
ncbi:hypothetical protein [Streptomyces albidochromogenes]|uniref:hypothetical protein n=1 Tax=Streptomyces albidochromogenes TaxID=329524 RepID=UPI0031343CBD